MKRRGNREGGEPRLRKDGRWQADYIGADHRRHSIITPRGSTKQDCRDALKAALRRADDGYAPADRRLTVGAWLDTWMTKHVAGGPRPRRARTVESYETVVRVHLKPRLGRIVLSKLTREQVGDTLADIGAKGAGPSTVRHVYTVLRVALNEAVKSDVLAQNVALRVTPPDVARQEMRPWDADEINAFLDVIEGDRFGPLYTVAIAAGMRQGEILGLRWGDVDLEAGTVTVARQWTRQGVMGPPKSVAGVRTIGLNELARWALRAQSARQARERLAAGPSWRSDDLVFTRTDGRALNHRVVQGAFSKRIRAAGLRPIRFHDLRHACATLLLTAGEELGVISRILGHSDLGVTLRVYAHLDPKRAKAAAGRIDAALHRHLVDAEPATG
jgi:integrase